jgi:hypothetical protein
MRFKNPDNGYEESANHPWLWTLIFGFIYFAVKGIWTHAVISFVLVTGLGVPTAGGGAILVWIVYPFFANGIVRRHYLRRGWREV